MRAEMGRAGRKKILRRAAATGVLAALLLGLVAGVVLPARAKVQNGRPRRVRRWNRQSRAKRSAFRWGPRHSAFRMPMAGGQTPSPGQKPFTVE